MTCGAGLLRGEFCHNDEDDNADDNDDDDDDDNDNADGRVVTGRVLPTQTRVTQLSQELQQDEGRRGELCTMTVMMMMMMMTLGDR